MCGRRDQVCFPNIGKSQWLVHGLCMLEGYGHTLSIIIIKNKHHYTIYTPFGTMGLAFAKKIKCM
jgi:hypothetical protein